MSKTPLPQVFHETCCRISIGRALPVLVRESLQSGLLNNMKRVRNQGSALTEMGPALFVLLILIFFPMLNLIQIGAAYALANTYHQHIIREIAFRRPEQKDTAIAAVNREIDANGLYQFIRVTNKTVDQVEFLDRTGTPINAPLPPVDDVSSAANDLRNSIAKVRVTTTMTIAPYFTIPFFQSIPGISAPVPFRVQTDKPQDEKGVN